MITYTQEELSSIVHAFAFPGTITDWTPHGNGHINDTFLVRSTENGVLRKSILQRMNRTVFHNPTELMQNIAQVTSFLRKKITAAGGDPFRETLNLIPTADALRFSVRLSFRDDPGFPQHTAPLPGAFTGGTGGSERTAEKRFG